MNYTEVKWTATKLHISPDETDRTRSWSLLQMRDSDSGPKPGLRGNLTLHLWYECTYVVNLAKFPPTVCKTSCSQPFSIQPQTHRQPLNTMPDHLWRHKKDCVCS